MQLECAPYLSNLTACGVLRTLFVPQAMAKQLLGKTRVRDSRGAFCVVKHSVSCKNPVIRCFQISNINWKTVYGTHGKIGAASRRKRKSRSRTRARRRQSWLLLAVVGALVFVHAGLIAGWFTQERMWMNVVHMAWRPLQMCVV